MFPDLRVVVCIGAVTVGAAWAEPAQAQERQPSLHVSIGSLHHASDLHPYYATQFDDALVIGAGATLPVNRTIDARVVLERAVTHLVGGQAFPDANRGPDHILAAEVQLTAAATFTDRVRPYVGAGIGLRRYVVNSSIRTDDIIHSPWAEAQIQPAFSALAGLGVGLTRNSGIAAELRWSRARFRAGEDSWGLPRDPVEWQNELRPAIRIEVSPW